MAKSTKLAPFFQRIDPQILKDWKETITRNESMRERLEKALLNDIKNHQKKNE